MRKRGGEHYTKNRANGEWILRSQLQIERNYMAKSIIRAKRNRNHKGIKAG